MLLLLFTTDEIESRRRKKGHSVANSVRSEAEMSLNEPNGAWIKTMKQKG